MAPKDKT